MSDDVAALKARIAELEKVSVFLEWENKAQARLLQMLIPNESDPELLLRIASKTTARDDATDQQRTRT